jgi:hypothetical protein
VGTTGTHVSLAQVRKFGDALKFAEDQNELIPATFVKAVKQLNSTMAKVERERQGWGGGGGACTCVRGRAHDHNRALGRKSIATALQVRLMSRPARRCQPKYTSS